jgi:hypothetical protein
MIAGSSRQKLSVITCLILVVLMLVFHIAIFGVSKFDAKYIVPQVILGFLFYFFAGYCVTFGDEFAIQLLQIFIISMYLSMQASLASGFMIAIDQTIATTKLDTPSGFQSSSTASEKFAATGSVLYNLSATYFSFSGIFFLSTFWRVFDLRAATDAPKL